MKGRTFTKLHSSSTRFSMIALNKSNENVAQESPEMLQFQRLLAAYKAKVFEHYVGLFQ